MTTTTRFYKATFKDGTVKIRSTATKFYTHAWRFSYITPYGKGEPTERFGFSSSAAQAAANLSSEISGWKGTNGEVAACLPCTKQGITTEAATETPKGTTTMTKTSKTSKTASLIEAATLEINAREKIASDKKASKKAIAATSARRPVKTSRKVAEQTKQTSRRSASPERMERDKQIVAVLKKGVTVGEFQKNTTLWTSGSMLSNIRSVAERTGHQIKKEGTRGKFVYKFVASK